MRGRLHAHIGVSVRKQDKHPLMPGLDHPHEAHPAEFGVFTVRLHNPVQVALPGVNEVGQVCFHKHIDCEALSRFVVQGQVELLDHAALSAISTEEIPRANLELKLRYVVTQDSCNYVCCTVFRK